MKQVELDKSTVDYPLDIAQSVLQEMNYYIEELEDSAGIVGFALPTGTGVMCSAVVEFLPGIGMLQITASLTRGVVSRPLVPGLRELLNELNLMFPGLTFTFDADEEDGDEIEISIATMVFEEKELQRDIKVMTICLQEAVKHSLPCIYNYVTQRLKVRVRQDGMVMSARPSLTVQQCLDMVETGYYGTA